MPANYNNLTHSQRSAARMRDMLCAAAHYQEASADLQVQLRDVITDLRHYADGYGLDFYAALDGSYSTYLEEKTDDAG